MMGIRFKPKDISLAYAIAIVKDGLEDPRIHLATKVMAIKKWRKWRPTIPSRRTSWWRRCGGFLSGMNLGRDNQCSM